MYMRMLEVQLKTADSINQKALASLHIKESLTFDPMHYYNNEIQIIDAKLQQQRFNQIDADNDG